MLTKSERAVTVNREGSRRGMTVIAMLMTTLGVGILTGIAMKTSTSLVPYQHHAIFSLEETSSSTLEGDTWSSLSSVFPPPRNPDLENRSLETDMEALSEWRKRTVEALSRGTHNPFCGSPQTELGKKCLEHNKKAAESILSAPSSGGDGEGRFLTRKTTGYNLRDFKIVSGNSLLTIGQISQAEEALFQNLKMHSTTTFLGISNQQAPPDAVAIGDLLSRVQPDLVIELGTSGGGSAVYYSTIMQAYNPKARFLTMDPAEGKLAGIALRQWNDNAVEAHCPYCQHSSTAEVWNKTVRFQQGYPDSDELLAIASEAVAKARTVVVIEDSNHLEDIVTRNLQAYYKFVTPGSYFIVQDTRLGGPHRAINKFLNSDNGTCFDIDKRWEYFLFSQHFDGFLRRRKNCTTAQSNA